MWVFRSGSQNRVYGYVDFVENVDLSKAKAFKDAKAAHKLHSVKQIFPDYEPGTSLWGWKFANPVLFKVPLVIGDECIARARKGGKRMLQMFASELTIDPELRKTHPVFVQGLPDMSLQSTAQFFMDAVHDGDYGRLEKTAKGLDGKTIRVGTTCSGTDAPVICLKHTIAAICARFKVSIHVKHVYSVENNPLKQQFILDTYKGELQHLFKDVGIFESGSGFCMIVGRDVKVPEIDVLISGPSCTDISNEKVPCFHVYYCRCRSWLPAIAFIACRFALACCC